MEPSGIVEAGNQFKIFKTTCNMCLSRCGINVYMKNGEITEVDGMPEHPLHKLCIKAHAIHELVKSSERLTNPLRRIGTEFVEVSWDEAFNFITDKLIDIK